MAEPPRDREPDRERDRVRDREGDRHRVRDREGESPQRPRRPVLASAAALESHGGAVDPTELVDLAHETAAVVVGAGRASADPALTAKLVALADELGLSTLAQLWSERPARSLPGALWRLYVVREWVRRAPAEAAREYAAGIRHATVNHVVAGAGEPTGPQEVDRLVEAVLRGVFDGDLAIALQRAAAFCRVVSAGRAELSDGEGQAQRAASLLDTAGDLDAAAHLWRRGQLR
ncbi:MAG TPA: hypothetical protein PLL54_00460 [Dermatophilaceae bacterium]|nr:hypothetical protein [Dermatophilaceae bacterium]